MHSVLVVKRYKCVYLMDYRKWVYTLARLNETPAYRVIDVLSSLYFKAIESV